MKIPPGRGTSRQELMRLADAYAEDVLAAPDHEILEDAATTGMDVAANARRMREMLTTAELKVGKAVMGAAQAAVRARAGRSTPPRQRTSGASRDAYALTLAARNGFAQSERDKTTVQDDIDELDELIAKRDPAP